MTGGFTRQRRGIVLGAACLAAAALTGGDASAQTKWRGGGINPANAPVSIGAVKFTEMVKERTNGRLLIDYFDSSKLGSMSQQMEAVALGSQQLYISSGVAPSNLVPEYGLLDAAFLFRDEAHFQKFLESPLAEELNKRLLDKAGIRTIAMNWLRLPRYFMHRSKFVLTPEDLKSVRVRAPNLPIHIRNWEMMGAVPVKIDYAEQYLAISQGVVEMTESAGEQMYSMKLHEVAPYITDAFYGYPQASVFVNDDAFRRLSRADQEILVKAAKEAGEFQNAIVRARFEPEWKKMQAEGAKFQAMTPEQRQRFAAMVRTHAAALEKDGLIPVGWWDRIQAIN